MYFTADPHVRLSIREALLDEVHAGDSIAYCTMNDHDIFSRQDEETISRLRNQKSENGKTPHLPRMVRVYLTLGGPSGLGGVTKKPPACLEQSTNNAVLYSTDEINLVSIPLGSLMALLASTPFPKATIRF